MATPENCFGDVVDDSLLDKMPRYAGRPKTPEDRAREAMRLINDGDKRGRASRYVDDIEARYGNGVSTKCIVYNATGSTLYVTSNYDWYKSGIFISNSVGYPDQIRNGQWAAFLHVHSSGEATGSEGAVVYRGKNLHGHDRDFLLAWCTPWDNFYTNKAYCEIGGDASFYVGHWDQIKDRLEGSGYSSNSTYDNVHIEVTTQRGDSPPFTATIRADYSP